jgi:hypothetical protein
LSSPLLPFPAWHCHQGIDWFRLQALDRSLLGAPSLYLAASEGVPWQATHGPISLRSDEWLGSGTLRNSFYAEPWARLSTARELSLIFDAQGTLRVRVMAASRGRPPIVLREARLDTAQRTRLTVPLGSLAALPEGCRLFWHIDAIDGARVFDAAWCTRSRPRESMRLAVLMRTFGRTADLRSQLARLSDGAAADPFHAALLARVDFWVLDSSGEAQTLWSDAAGQGLNLRVLSAPNLGGGGNASHLIHQLLSHCDAEPATAPDEVLILDDDGLLSMESLARHVMASALRSGEHITSLPVLMKSRPTRVWEDGGFWGRLDFREQGGFARRRSLFPHLLKHGLSLDGFEHLDDFGPLNTCEYATFIFYALPLATLRRLGLPAAFFLRGDDIEYSLRAQAAGIPLVTNPNLAAWHEPGHSYPQEYMAILHAVLINFVHSDGGAAELSRWFEQRLAEHASIGDLDGVTLYLRVLEALLDVDGPLLTTHFEEHYARALPALQAPRLTPLPEADRERIEREVGEHGVLLRPFLYPGYQAKADGHRAVVLCNAGSGTYVELPPADPLARLPLMQRYLAELEQVVNGFEELRSHWCRRLASSGQPVFWNEVARRHASQTRCLHEGRFQMPPAPAELAVGFGPDAANDAQPPSVPIRELRLRLERELSQLSRLRQREAAAAPARPRGARALLAWWRRRSSPQDKAASSKRPARLPVPQDFDPAQYLALNADVARSGVDAATHYAEFGRAEGRRYRV